MVLPCNRDKPGLYEYLGLTFQDDVVGLTKSCPCCEGDAILDRGAYGSTDRNFLDGLSIQESSSSREVK